MRIQWSNNAINDLQQIKNYISQGSPSYSTIFVNKVFDTTNKILGFPQIGRKVPEMNREDIREIILQNYRIIYLVRSEAITILSVIHGARNLQGYNMNLE